MPADSPPDPDAPEEPEAPGAAPAEGVTSRTQRVHAPPAEGPAAGASNASEDAAGDAAGAEPPGGHTSGGETDPVWSRLPFALRKSVRLLTVAGVGLFALAFFYTLYFAAGFFLPVVIALVLNLLFRPLVRWMRLRAGLPDPLGAAVVILVVLGVFAFGLYEGSGPAQRWVRQAPTYLRRAETDLRGLFESMQNVSQSAAAVGNQISGTGDAARDSSEASSQEQKPQPVTVQGRSAADVLLSQTRNFLVDAAVVFFLLYFLLASGDLFLRKIVHVVPLFRQKRVAVQIARSAERDLSTYLSTYALINSVLGTVVGTILYLLGMPSPVLWGVMAALLNFVPYLGAAVGESIVAVVAFVTIEPTSRALLAPLLYFLVNALEGNLITPLILGRRLQLNPVAIFISLTFWYWIWGVPGALLATPLLVSLKVVCDNVITLRALGEFIGR